MTALPIIYIITFLILKNVDVVRNDKIDGKTILRKKYDRIVTHLAQETQIKLGIVLKL